jgi:hypothetical protein
MYYRLQVQLKLNLFNISQFPFYLSFLFHIQFTLNFHVDALIFIIILVLYLSDIFQSIKYYNLEIFHFLDLFWWISLKKLNYLEHSSLLVLRLEVHSILVLLCYVLLARFLRIRILDYLVTIITMNNFMFSAVHQLIHFCINLKLL